MFEWSKNSIVFLKGHSPYDGSEVFVNAAMVAGSEVREIYANRKQVRGTCIETVGSDGHGSYKVKESFQELIDQANGTASKATGV